MALPPADRGDDRLPREEVREAAGDRRGEREGLPGGLRVRRDDRVLRGPLRGEAGPAEAGDVPQHHRQPGALARPRRRVEAVGAAALPGRLPDHAGVVGARGAGPLQELRRPHLPGRGRDRGRGRGARRQLRRRARRHRLLGAGHRAQGGDDRARDAARAPPRDLRHPARGPLDRDADEAGAGRPARRPLRPQRRVAGAGRRGDDPGRLLLGRARGGADRAEVQDAGLPALGRLPGERLRAVARAGRLGAAGHLDRLRDRAEPRGRVPALPARPADAGAAVGGAGDAGARAPDRRAREGRRHRQHLLRPRQPRPDDAPARAEGRRDRLRHPRARGRRRRGREAARARLGRHLRPRHRGRPPRPRERRQGRPRAPPLPEPVPAQPRRGAARLRQGADPGDEPGPAAQARARGVPRRRGRLQHGARASRSGRPCWPRRSRRCSDGRGATAS